ncbi:MAG: hypothetical protein JNK87_03350 [Bryobacterales bacterium]|nr:hypothetical protein [Bryobacterales bacterium]
MTRGKKILIAAAVLLTAGATGIWLAVRKASENVEPYLREQVIAYLGKRFDADVRLDDLRITSKMASPWRTAMDGGRGAFLQVEARGIELKQHARADQPPLVKMQRLRFEFELASVRLKPPLQVRHIRLEGFELTIPPKGDRPKTPRAAKPGDGKKADDDKGPVIVDAVIADGMKLRVLPKDPKKAPLEFDMFKLQLRDAGQGVPIQYDAVLTNPKPDGLVESKGSFGPFDTDEPGESPLTGDYVFRKADLGVFKSIGGILDSTGKFSGKLNEIVVDGEARVPDFRLSAVKNTVPLSTKFHAIVDGTNGDTLLQPVYAKLGSTNLTIRGAVQRYPGENGKTVALTAMAKGGKLDDFLRLAVKGNQPPLRGGIDLNIKLTVPPGKGIPYDQKLIVGGTFELDDTVFTSGETQAKLDDLSRRAQGKPNNTAIEKVPSDFAGVFDLRRGLLQLRQIMFTIPGAEVNLAGHMNLNDETMEFAGPVRTQGRVSQMVKSRWKRILLKPVDPFLAKDGAGAVFYLTISGSRAKPDFKVSLKAPKNSD